MVISLFIGRFQPFHNGHLWAVKQILRDSEKIIIGIGSSDKKGTAVNPFSAEERKDMIEAALKKEGISNYVIFLIPDLSSDCRWVEHVKKLIPYFDAVYTGSPLSRQLFTKNGCLVRPLQRHRNISASEIRLRILKNMEWKHLVPGPVAEILKEIAGVKKIRSISS